MPSDLTMPFHAMRCDADRQSLSEHKDNLYVFGGESYKPYMYHNSVSKLTVAAHNAAGGAGALRGLASRATAAFFGSTEADDDDDDSAAAPSTTTAAMSSSTTVTAAPSRASSAVRSATLGSVNSVAAVAAAAAAAVAALLV